MSCGPALGYLATDVTRLQGQTAWKPAPFPRLTAVNSKIAISKQCMFIIICSWQPRKKHLSWFSWHPGSVVDGVDGCSSLLLFWSFPAALRFRLGLNNPSSLVPVNLQPSGLQISVWNTMPKALCFLHWWTDKNKGQQTEIQLKQGRVNPSAEDSPLDVLAPAARHLNSRAVSKRWHVKYEKWPSLFNMLAFPLLSALLSEHLI